MAPPSASGDNADEGGENEAGDENAGIEMQLGPDRLPTSASDDAYYDGGIGDTDLDVEYGDTSGCGDAGIEMQLGPNRPPTSASDADYYDGGMHTEDTDLDVEYGDTNGGGDAATIDSHGHDVIAVAVAGAEAEVGDDGDA